MALQRPRILILTTHTGGGHLNLAQALKGVLEPYYDVVIVDPQSALVEHFYATVSRYFLKFLEWQFIFTDNDMASFLLHWLLTPMSHQRLLNIIEHVQPELIITTHALLSHAITRANTSLRKPVPLVFQYTDLGRLHTTWFTEKHADAYLAPTKEIYAQAVEQNITKNSLYLTGRPVRPQFLEVSLMQRSDTLAALGFDPAIFTIFLQGGAMGASGVDQTIENLLAMNMPMQILLAVGNNKRMAVRYTGIEHIRVLPFTEKIALYMAAVDVIAGKAGASFISEAFILEKPFIATAYIPGQETPNLQFIKRHNLGWVCLEKRAQQELLMKLASNPAMIAEKVKSIQVYKAWNMQANRDIYKVIEQLLPIISAQEAD